MTQYDPRTVDVRPPRSPLHRFFGGSPAMVLVRLILLSVLVGVILSAVGLDPMNLMESLDRLIRSVWSMGFDAISWMGRYFILGAVIVIPIWVIVRVVKAPMERR